METWGKPRNSIGHPHSGRRARHDSVIRLFRRVPLLLRIGIWFGLVLALVLPYPAAAGEDSESIEKKAIAVAVFGGVLTNNQWEDVFTPWDIDTRDSTLAGLAISYGIGRIDPRFGFEIEGQIVHHFGDQDNWEFNLPIIARWKAFPWDDVVDTSLAFGIGPSYASEKPKVEVANEGDSQRWLVYWMAEIEVGPPDKDWSAIFRLHHRSEAFGLIADEGGSNSIVIGFKQRF